MALLVQSVEPCSGPLPQMFVQEPRLGCRFLSLIRLKSGKGGFRVLPCCEHDGAVRVGTDRRVRSLHRSSQSGLSRSDLPGSRNGEALGKISHPDLEVLSALTKVPLPLRVVMPEGRKVSPHQRLEIGVSAHPRRQSPHATRVKVTPRWSPGRSWITWHTDAPNCRGVFMIDRPLRDRQRSDDAG